MWLFLVVWWFWWLTWWSWLWLFLVVVAFELCLQLVAECMTCPLKVVVIAVKPHLYTEVLHKLAGEGRR